MFIVCCIQFGHSALAADPVCEPMQRAAQEARAKTDIATLLRWRKALETAGCSVETIALPDVSCTQLEEAYQGALKRADLRAGSAIRERLEDQCQSQTASTTEGGVNPSPPGAAASMRPVEAGASVTAPSIPGGAEPAARSGRAREMFADALAGRNLDDPYPVDTSQRSPNSGPNIFQIGSAMSAAGLGLGGVGGQVLQQHGQALNQMGQLTAQAMGVPANTGNSTGSSTTTAANSSSGTPATSEAPSVGMQATGAFLAGAGVGLGGERGQALTQLGNQMGGQDVTAGMPNILPLQPAVPGAQAQAGLPGSCPEDLSQVRLPQFSHHQLASLRQEFYKTRTRETIAKAKAQGYSASAAIQAAMAQAAEHEKQVRQGSQCAADVDAFGTTDDQFLFRINRHQYTNLSCEGIRGSCLCAAIGNKMGAVAARRLAGAMRCFAGQGRW